MKTIAALICLTTLTGCALVIDREEADRIKQCQELPTPGERRLCEQAASDSMNDRYYNEQRGMVKKDRYTLPRDICETGDKYACDFD